MAKTYTLHPIAIVHGRGKSSSYLSDGWSNLFNYHPNELYAGMDGSWVEDAYGGHIWNEMHCLNFMFDQATLDTLRTKTIQSITFSTKVTGTLKANTDEDRHQIRYRLNETSGAGTASTSPYWKSAEDAGATDEGRTVVGLIGSATAEAQEVTNQQITVPLSGAVPKYGYVIGPSAIHHRGSKGLLTISSTLTDTTLTVVTDEVDTHTVTYSANEGVDAPPAQTFNAGASVTLSGVRPTRTGYNFLGWSENQSATTASYAPGSTQTFNGDVTLYAVWQLKSYTVTFNANGGSNAPDPQTKTHGVNLTLSSSQPTRTGYAFCGWAVSSSATTADYASGGTYSADESTTLYAVWSASSGEHTLTYNANGGTGAPPPETKTYSAGSPTSFTVSSVQPSRSGYRFLGWSSSAGGTVQYTAGDSISASEDRTLYAVWSPVYTVTFDANGGTGAPAAQTKYHDIALTLPGTVPARAGNNFLGWAESANAATAAYQAGGSFVKNQSMTLYAVWQLKTYSVSYDANGGTNAPAAQTKTHGQTLVLSSQKPGRTGFWFRGWGITSDADKATYVPGGNYTNNASIVLYAVWQQKVIITESEKAKKTGMNLNEILSDTIAILGLGTESTSGNVYMREFTRYANDAIQLISRRFRQSRTETLPLDDEHCFKLIDLDRVCYRIDRIRTLDGHDVMWEQPDRGSGDVFCFLPYREEKERVQVTYQFRPAKLVNLEDEPELPEYARDLIPHYIAAQHLSGKDGMTNKEMQTFERMLNDLVLEYYGERRAYKLRGYNEGLL